MAQVEALIEVVLGVDTHLDVHVGVIVDPVGRVLGTRSIETCTKGYQDLLEWACSYGFLLRAGVEGTETYGAGLTRHLQEAGIKVLEVNRPDRARRRRRGKNVPTDAESAARAALSGEACALSKAQSGAVEGMRVLTVARRRAVKARTQALNQFAAC
ncbi:transposase [Halomonas sp. YLB-10]|uniref:IS110 family transposase n=1 Tax=Halomonas sp. YLB-10 TaxID=2483111 RepID=UPI001639A5C1|nr:transposase [Halomonas sp. YLB-10]